MPQGAVGTHISEARCGAPAPVIVGLLGGDVGDALVSGWFIPLLTRKWQGAPRLAFETWVYDLRVPRDLVRYQETGNWHFVTFSCYGRRPYLGTSEARDGLERTLERMRLRYDFLVSAYVVMPEHVPLLIREPRAVRLATALQAIKLSVAAQRTEPPFWTPRYYDFDVWIERQLIEKRRYIHRNAVWRGLVAEPDQWRWSSFRHWWTGEVGALEVESDWTAARRTGLGWAGLGWVGVIKLWRAREPTSQRRGVGHPLLRVCRIESWSTRPPATNSIICLRIIWSCIVFVRRLRSFQRLQLLTTALRPNAVAEELSIERRPKLTN